MTREELDFIGSMNMCDEISNEAYKKIMCHCEEQEPCEDCVSRETARRIVDSGRTKQQMIDMILATPSVTPTQRWIPVSERLPVDENQDKKLWEQKVLITGYLSFDDKKELFVSEAFIDDVINNNVYDTIVTAWMPKPKPYRAESENK